MRFLIRNIFLLLILIFTANITNAASVKITIEPQRGKRSIAVGDVFYLSISIDNMDGEIDKPASVPGARISYFGLTGSSSSVQIINGKTTQSKSIIYTATLKAIEEGKFSYGPVIVNGVKSNSVSYTIGPADSNSGPTPTNNNNTADNSESKQGPKFIGKGDGNIFLRASVSKTSAYEQEALLYTVKLYTTYAGIKFIGATAAPKFEGFVVEESKNISSSLSYETYQGKSYATAVIARYVIFPQKAGILKVIGNTYTVSVDEREYYHDPFWGQMSVSKPLQLNVTPNDLSVNVKGLPEPIPADFSGGVGNFSISSSFPSKDYKTNQGASAVYTITGSGNLKYIKLPDLNVIYPKELEVFSPNTQIDVNVTASNVSGNVKFDYSFIPQQEGRFTIPNVTLVYFNPETSQYVRKSATGVSINVGKGIESSKSQTKNAIKFNPELLKVEHLSHTHIPYIYNLLYWLLFLIPTLALIVIYFIYRKYVNDRADIISFKSKKAARVAKSRLKKAASALKRNEREQFYNELLNAIWGYLGDKLKMPASELNRENIADKLLYKNVDNILVDNLLNIIDTAEFAQYTPVSQSSHGDMSEIYKKAVDVINNIEDTFKKSKNEK
jgi:hypothetical protein